MTVPFLPDSAPDNTYLLTTDQASKLLEISSGTLRTWRCHGQGPAFIAISPRCIRYRFEDLKEWAEARLSGGAK